MNKYYLYVHYRESDGTPFYVGKGSGKRAWTTQHRNKFWENTKNKHGIKVEILFDGLSEEETFQCERDAILEFTYLGYKLTNLTPGGEGASYKRSLETRIKMGNASRGRKYSDEIKRKIGQSRTYPKGIENSNSDKESYSFIRISDGLIFTGTRIDLCSTFDLKTTLINGLFKSRKRNIACGWKLNERVEHGN